MMKNKLIPMILACLLLVGCTAPPAETTLPPETTVPVETTTPVETTQPAAETLDLAQVYQAGMDSYAANGEEAPVLFPESDVNYLENFYPGLAAIELKQLCAGVAPVTNAPFEVVLVEVAREADVQTVLDIFQTRADQEADDTSYPENAEAWLNNVRITSRGNYVFLAVMMEPYRIPSEFILD